MPNSKYTQTIVLRTADCDMFGTWRPSAILEVMQETAGIHSAQCGLPRNVLDEMGVAWVISRTRVEMQRLAHAGESLTVETYPTPNRHMFFPRSHIFRDASGEVIGSANSLWVLIDFESRAVVKRDDIAAMLPDNRDLKPAAGMPATVRPLAGETVTGEIIPQFTDMDVNVHVNNTKYLDWCCNALGVSVMQSHCLMRFDVNYEAEIRPGTSIETGLTRQDNRFSFCGKAGDRHHFSIGGELCPR